MPEITAKQWALAEDLLGDVRENIEIIVGRTHQDIFEQYLGGWAIVLGTLALDVYSSVQLLLRAEKWRAAYMLSRSLIDYHLRLRHYVSQAKPIIARYRAKPTKSIKNHLQKMNAYKDWENANAKLLTTIKDRPLDLDLLPTDQRADFVQKLGREYVTYSRNVKHMAREATNDDAQFGWTYSTYLFQSGYLHGDQIVISEVIKNNPEGGMMTVYFDSEKMSPLHILAEATFYILRIMESFGMVHGWAYGYVYGNIHAAEAYPVARHHQPSV